MLLPITGQNRIESSLMLIYNMDTVSPLSMEVRDYDETIGLTTLLTMLLFSWEEGLYIYETKVLLL